MTEKENSNNSLIPITSTGLVRVGNSIEVTNKILSEFKDRRLANFKFKGETVFQYFRNTGAINQLDINNDILYIGCGSNDGSLVAWDINDNTIDAEFTAIHGMIEALSVSSKNNIAAIGGFQDFSTTIIDLENGNIIKKLIGHTRSISAVKFSPDGNFLITASHDKTLKVWETTNWKCLHTLEGHEAIILSIEFSDNGEFLYSGGWDFYIIEWDFQKLAQTRKIEAGWDTKILKITKDCRYLVIGSGDKLIRIFNLKKNITETILQGHTDFVSALEFAENETLLFSGGWDGKIIVWDFMDRELMKSIDAHSREISSLKYNSNNKTLTSGSWDKTVKFWV